MGGKKEMGKKKKKKEKREGGLSSAFLSTLLPYSSTGISFLSL